MKNILFLMALLVLVTGILEAQIVTREYYFRVPLVRNETDTVPGTHTGGPGAGGAGWLWVGTDDVEYSMAATDSLIATITFDFTDSGYTAAAGRSAYSVGLKTRTRTVGATGLDSLATSLTGTPGMISAMVRQRGVSSPGLGGGRWIRARIFGVDSDDFAGTAAGRTVTLRIRCLKNN